MPGCQSRPKSPTTPNVQRLTAITHARFSLIRFRSPLLTESRLLSLPVGTEMFHFPTFPPHTLYIQVQVTGHDSSRVSPFGNPRITVWLSTPRGLSQIPTSFFGSWCQGIHRAPLKTWPQRCSRPLYSSQHTTPPHNPDTQQRTELMRGTQQKHHHTPEPTPADPQRSTEPGPACSPMSQDPTTCHNTPDPPQLSPPADESAGRTHHDITSAPTFDVPPRAPPPHTRR